MKMSSLKDSLKGWTGPPKVADVLEPRHIRAAGRKVEEQLGGMELTEPEPYDQKELYQRIRESWGRENSLERISARDLRRVPFVLFYPPGQDNHMKRQGPTGWLGLQPGFVREYDRWLSDGYRASSVRALLLEFLRVYPVGLQTFDDLRRVLEKTLNGTALPPPSLHKWTQRSAEFGLLEKDGDLSFVEKLTSATDPVDHFLGQAGFDAGLARCSFLESGIRKFLPSLSARLARNSVDDTQLVRVLALLECEGRLRFDDLPMRSEVAAALLRPCADRGPEPATKKLLQPFFLHHFGDPRLQSGKHRWSGIPEDVRRVVIRWLVERALEQFFLLVKDTALDRHWRYREAFWRAFLPLEPDVWFVLGPRAERLLEKMNEREKEDEATSILRGAQGDQSVLLLRLPGVTIAEWSHNGACRFWLDGTPGAPALYKGTYSREDLVGDPDFLQRHDGSSEGRWQDWIAHWLRDNTGVEISRAKYFPDRLQEGQTDHHPRYTLSARGAHSQAAAPNIHGGPSQTDLTETIHKDVPVRRIPQGVSGQELADRPKPTTGGGAAAALQELREVRGSVLAARKLRVDLRAFMDASSQAWGAYTADHGVPGHGTRMNTVLDRLDSTIARLRSRVIWGKSST